MLEMKAFSKALNQIQLRLSALKSIDPDLDLGEGVTVRILTELVNETRDEWDEFNTELEVLKAKYKKLREKESQVAVLSDRIVDGVAFKFGRKSREFRMISSIRRNNRSRSPRRVTRETSPTESTELSSTVD
jgi:hypothetical protein